MKTNKEFSKLLLIQESALIWILTISFILLAALCIVKDYAGSLPWLTAMTSLPWAAYGVSQCFYYNKATKENTMGGIKYETVMSNIQAATAAANIVIEEEEKNKNTTLDIDYGI